ncbi:hypothetical protein MMC34_003161 [Xylographa carneopallida]|nr:hypothetical protein [Xylographa carneopallida]
MKPSSLVVIVQLGSTIAIAVASSFQSFYPKYRPELQNLSRHVCNESLALMEGTIFKSDAPSTASASDYCWGHENCLLANLPAAYLADYLAASVLMGPTPTLLGSFGPSIAETSILSAHRPLLAFFISLGAPAIFPTRVFHFYDPYTILVSEEYMLRLPRLRKRAATFLIILEYILALAAGATIIVASVQLGAKTMLVWNCQPLKNTKLQPSEKVEFHKVNGSEEAANDTLKNVLPSTSELGTDHDSNNKQLDHEREPTITHRLRPTLKQIHLTSQRVLTKLRSSFKDETQLCANHQCLRVHKIDSPTTTAPNWRVLLSCGADLVGLGHMAFGTFVFSSLTFISTGDFVCYVVWRWPGFGPSRKSSKEGGVVVR